MSSVPDPQLQRALTALRALEPPSNGFELRLRGSLLQAAADPALFPRRAAKRPAPLQLWRRRPLAALSLAALSLAGVAAAITAQRWLPWQRSELAAAPVFSPEPPRAATSRPAASEAAPAPEVPRVLELPPAAEPGPVQPPSLAPPPQAEQVSIPERPHRAAPARDPGSRPAPPSPKLEPEHAAAPVAVPRFDLPDVPAHDVEHGSALRGEQVDRRVDRAPSPDDRSPALDRASEARDRAAERRRAQDRPRPILESPPALDRDRRGPSDVHEREHEIPEPRESESGRGRRD